MVSHRLQTRIHLCRKTHPKYDQPGLEAAVGIVFMRVCSERRLGGHWVGFLILHDRVDETRSGGQDNTRSKVEFTRERMLGLGRWAIMSTKNAGAEGLL
jgi:hypothetical protein